MSDARAALRGWTWLTASMVQRFLREGMVLRSMVFPASLVIAVILGTVGFVTWWRVEGTAVTPSMATPEFRAAIEEAGGAVIVSDDPEAVVRSGQASYGTDGKTLWVDRSGMPPKGLEPAIRKQLGTVWRQYQVLETRRSEATAGTGSARIAQFIGVLFAMYGVVFGAGAIARDRDDGTLDAELSVALPMWVAALARWSAATLVLGLFYATSVAMVDAVIGLPNPWALALNGATAASTASAVGMAVIGRGGKTRGFAGPMSAGLVIVMGLYSVGLARPELAPHIPVGSITATSVGAAPWVALCMGPLNAWWFARRVAVG